jgi:hypothetical protein
MAIKNDEILVLDKDTQIAFCSFRKVRLMPFVVPPRRVKFKGRKKDISHALAELTSNPSVPILDFLSHLSAIRSVIFTLKNQENEHGESSN